MLLSLLVLVVFVCLFVYVVQAWGPPAPIRNLLFVVLLACVLLWLIGGMGALGPGYRFR